MLASASITHQNRRPLLPHVFQGIFRKTSLYLLFPTITPGSTEKGERACYFPWIRPALEQREHRRTRNENYNGATRHSSRPRTLRLYYPQKTRPRLPTSPGPYRTARQHFQRRCVGNSRRWIWLPQTGTLSTREYGCLCLTVTDPPLWLTDR